MAGVQMACSRNNGRQKTGALDKTSRKFMGFRIPIMAGGDLFPTGRDNHVRMRWSKQEIPRIQYSRPRIARA